MIKDLLPFSTAHESADKTCGLSFLHAHTHKTNDPVYDDPAHGEVFASVKPHFSRGVVNMACQSHTDQTSCNLAQNIGQVE